MNAEARRIHTELKKWKEKERNAQLGVDFHGDVCASCIANNTKAMCEDCEYNKERSDE